MGGFTLNEKAEIGILDFLENKAGKYEERNPFAHSPKANYSPATLVNEWYEDRFAMQKIPAESNLPLTTEYKDNYMKLCQYTVPHRKDYFKMVFDSQGLGQEILMDHLEKSYYNNFTTTYDLCYNHLAKGLCGPFPRKYVKGKYIPETDMTLIYGNLTRWGLREKIMKKTEPTCKTLALLPEYTTEFVHFDRKEVKRLNDFPFRGKKKSEFKLINIRNRS